jgi:tRNA dimethylallyltransferase
MLPQKMMLASTPAMKKHKTVIIIAGPTASGKTRIAIDLALQLQTEIISADSRQCYKELNIGVARPSEKDLKLVPHHFIASHSIHEQLTAADFEDYALKKSEALFVDHDFIVMAGGTGMYIKAFVDGLDKIPQIDPMIRETISINYNQQGILWLQSELNKKDPMFSQQGEMQNPQRMMRALEVVEGTGQSILSFHNKIKSSRPFNTVRLCVELSMQELTANIHVRTANMFADGLLEEARSLNSFRHLNALQTVGYAELFDFFDGKISFDEAVANISIHTRQYAKRQITWFKKDKNYSWVRPGDFKTVISEFMPGA